MPILNETVSVAEDILQVVDAAYRFGAGVDQGDVELIGSAFTDQVEIDFGPCGCKMNLDFPILNGKEKVVGFLSAATKTQITSHVITNERVYIYGQKAKLCCLVDANHIIRADRMRYCRMMNWYEADLTKVDAIWQIRRLVIDNIWFSGNPNVLSGN